MARVYREYERRKADQGMSTSRISSARGALFDADAGALAQVRERYRAFTVDEYQDVNLLQQSLLDRWLGERDELCAIGDDSPVHLRVHGRAPEYLLNAGAVPRRDGRPARGQLPVDPQVRQPRTCSSLSSAARRRCCGRYTLVGPSR